MDVSISFDFLSMDVSISFPQIGDVPPEQRRADYLADGLDDGTVGVTGDVTGDDPRSEQRMDKSVLLLMF